MEKPTRKKFSFILFLSVFSIEYAEAAPSNLPTHLDTNNCYASQVTWNACDSKDNSQALHGTCWGMTVNLPPAIAFTTARWYPCPRTSATNRNLNNQYTLQAFDDGGKVIFEAHRGDSSMVLPSSLNTGICTSHGGTYVYNKGGDILSWGCASTSLANAVAAVCASQPANGQQVLLPTTTKLKPDDTTSCTTNSSLIPPPKAAKGAKGAISL